MADREFGLETLCLHAGQLPDPATGARAVPLYQTTSYVFDNADHAASLFNLQTFGNVYTRLTNPTTAVFEERMAALEGGRAAVATASGMAATMTAMLTLLEAGDHIVAASTLYGGTPFAVRRQLSQARHRDHLRRRRRSGRTSRAAISRQHPRGLRRDHRQPVAERARHRGGGRRRARARPAAGRRQHLPHARTCAGPFEHGADIVVHSATKYIGGHGTSIGGVIVESGRFPWDNGKFPGMTEPSPGYHGVRFYETFGDFGFTMKARCEILRTFGAGAEPVQRLPVPAGPGEAARAHGAALRQHARRGAPPGRASRGVLGELPGPGGQPLPRPRAGATCRAARAPCSPSASTAAPRPA